MRYSFLSFILEFNSILFFNHYPMYLKSKFKLWAFFPIILLVIATALLIFTLSAFFTRHSLSLPGAILLLVFFFFIWIWSLFGELRTKVIKVEIRDKEISVSGYLGMGAKKIFTYSEIEGFETAILPSKYDTYEFLYIIKNGKKIIKISEFYHRNYGDLKFALSDKVRSLGQKNYSLFRDVKEIFI